MDQFDFAEKVERIIRIVFCECVAELENAIKF